jgi:hypothetical protein
LLFAECKTESQRHLINRYAALSPVKHTIIDDYAVAKNAGLPAKVPRDEKESLSRLC